MLGRTEQFTPVRFAAPAQPGSMHNVSIRGHDGQHLLST
jgi:hypothetical protein